MTCTNCAAPAEANALPGDPFFARCDNCKAVFVNPAAAAPSTRLPRPNALIVTGSIASDSAGAGPYREAQPA
jgi:hypothetical protein